MVLPLDDDYGFQLILHPHDTILAMAQQYQLYENSNYDSLLASADERKEIPSADEEVCAHVRLKGEFSRRRLYENSNYG